VVGMTALGMQEYDARGNAVGKYISLKHTSLYNKINAEDGNLNGLSFSYTPSDTSAKVTVTYITSMKAGIVEYGNSPVSPRSFEMIIEITGFPLSDAANHVRMDIGILTSPGVGKVESNSVVLRRKGQEDMYVGLSSYTIVDGERASVSVSMESGEVDTGDVSKKILKTALGGDFDAQIAHIDFPAGRGDFIYDPALGSGKNVYAAAESSSGNSENSHLHGSSGSNEGSNGKSNDLTTSDDEEGGLGVITISLIAVGAFVLASVVVILGVCLAKKKKKEEDDVDEKDISKTYIDDENDPDIARTYIDDDELDGIEMDAPSRPAPSSPAVDTTV